jgi:hypothetical protein
MKSSTFILLFLLTSVAFASEFEYLCKGAFDPDRENTEVYLLKTSKNKKTASISGTQKIDLLYLDENDTTIEFENQSRRKREIYILEKELFSGKGGSIFSGSRDTRSFDKFADCKKI